MLRAIQFLFVVAILVVLAPMADASVIFDPGAAAPGSASALNPLFNGPLPAQATTDQALEGSGHRSSTSSDLYLVPNATGVPGLPSAYSPDGFVHPLLPASDPADAEAFNWVPVDLNGLVGPTSSSSDLDGGEWLALDLRRGRSPAISTPTGGEQQQTPATPAPEPAGVILLAMGLGVVGAMRLLRARFVRVSI